MNAIPTLPSGIVNLQQATKCLQEIITYLNAEKSKQRVFNYSDDATAKTDEDCQHVRFDCSAGDCDYTLSTLLPVGWRVTVIKIDATANTVNIVGTGIYINSESLGTTPDWTLSGEFETVHLVHAGSGVYDVV